MEELSLSQKIDAVDGAVDAAHDALDQAIAAYRLLKNRGDSPDIRERRRFSFDTMQQEKDRLIHGLTLLVCLQERRIKELEAVDASSAPEAKEPDTEFHPSTSEDEAPTKGPGKRRKRPYSEKKRERLAADWRAAHPDEPSGATA